MNRTVTVCFNDACSVYPVEFPDFPDFPDSRYATPVDRPTISYANARETRYAVMSNEMKSANAARLLRERLKVE